MHAACVHTPARIDRSIGVHRAHARSPLPLPLVASCSPKSPAATFAGIYTIFSRQHSASPNPDRTDGWHNTCSGFCPRSINSCCRCKLQQVRAAGLLKPTGVNAPSKYTSTTNVLPRAYRGRPGDARRGGRRAQAAPRTRVGVWTTCPPHVHRLRASLACLPSPTASAFGRRSGVDDWTRARRCWLLTDWATAVLAAAKYFSGIHAMHGTTREGGRLALLRLHCYFFSLPRRC
jgi:hypothetical protein